MKYCSRCGKSNKNNSDYCSECGKKFEMIKDTNTHGENKSNRPINRVNFVGVRETKQTILILYLVGIIWGICVPLVSGISKIIVMIVGIACVDAISQHIPNQSKKERTKLLVASRILCK
jgi:uncharacterized membrane protein YvbJ